MQKITTDLLACWQACKAVSGPWYDKSRIAWGCICLLYHFTFSIGSTGNSCPFARCQKQFRSVQSASMTSMATSCWRWRAWLRQEWSAKPHAEHCFQNYCILLVSCSLAVHDDAVYIVVAPIPALVSAQTFVHICSCQAGVPSINQPSVLSVGLSGRVSRQRQWP